MWVPSLGLNWLGQREVRPMRMLLPIALLSFLGITSCSPEDAKEAGTEPPALPNQPPAPLSLSPKERTASLQSQSTNHDNGFHTSPSDPASIVPRRVGDFAPQDIFTKDEMEKARSKQKEDRANLEKHIAEDTAALNAQRKKFEDQQHQFLTEAAAAAEKLDGTSRVRLERIAKDLAEALTAHQKALSDTKAPAREAAKEAAATTKLRLEQALEKAREQLQQQKNELQDAEKNLFDRVINAATKAASLG